MTRSFRFKLAMRAAVGVTLGLIALSAVTLLTLRSVLDRDLMSSILNVASIQAASLVDGPTGGMRFHEWELTPDEAASVRDLIQYTQVWQADGTSLLRSRYMTSDLTVDYRDLARAAAGELVWTEQFFDGSPIRTLYYPLERLGAAHQAHVLQVGAPLRGRNEMLGRATWFFVGMTVLLGMATYGGSWWLAGSAIRPIHEVIDQAEEIGAGSLDRGIQAHAGTLEYRRLVEVLNTMLKRIDGAFDAQRRFTADASHELRSPLTAMRGEIELALRRVRGPEEYAKVLESTLEEVVRLSRITEDLLTLARSDSGALRPRIEVVDAAEIVARVVERLEPRAEKKGVALDLEAEGEVSALLDPGLLGQIVWNLMDNALKFTPSGASVHVSVVERGGELRVVVTDSGPGLGDVDPTTPFERFFRADLARTVDSETAGTGLGLAIVKAATEAHAGTVTAETRSEGGARFIVRIPSFPIDQERGP